MYFFLFITSFLKTFDPYLRKHILDSLESHEFLFLNTLLVSLFVFSFFLYKILFHDDMFDKLMNKAINLTFLQIIYFMLIAFITVISSIVIIQFDKEYNTPLINSLLLKGFTAVLLLLVGIFIYKENYNIKQIAGIFLTIIGLFLTTCKK